jgi:integrase/recombinase XerD
MTPLRQRLLEDLQRRNYSPKTISCYVAHVAQFARHFGRSPDQLGADDIRAWQLHLLQVKHASWSAYNQSVCALRFFYGICLQQPELVTALPYGKRPKTLPTVLSRDEVLQFFAAFATDPDRLIVRTTYACGLRIGEVVRLRVADAAVGSNRCRRGDRQARWPGVSRAVTTALRGWVGKQGIICLRGRAEGHYNQRVR